MLWGLTWAAEAHWSILLPILETMGLCDTLAVVLLGETTQTVFTARLWKLVCSSCRFIISSHLFWADLFKNSAFSPIWKKQSEVHVHERGSMAPSLLQSSGNSQQKQQQPLVWRSGCHILHTCSLLPALLSR